MEMLSRKYELEVGSTPSSFNALVIEDDPGVADLLRRIFCGCGCEIDLVKTVQEGISRSAKKMYDLVLLDVKQRHLNVTEQIPELRQHSPGAEIITMTAFNPKIVETKVREQKVTYHLIKPFDMREITSLINHFVVRKNNFLNPHNN